MASRRAMAMGDRHRPLLLGVLALGAAAAGLGLIAGRASLPATESEIIEAFAARYVAETGGALTDCLARPGDLALADTPVWITVICTGTEGVFVYPVDRKGRLVPPDMGGI